MIHVCDHFSQVLHINATKKPQKTRLDKKSFQKKVRQFSFSDTQICLKGFKNAERKPNVIKLLI